MITDCIPDYFCWSKMGSEAGEDLESILRRKEVERIANGGIFAWGVGNSLGDSLSKLTKAVSEPLVIFSPMKAKPKHMDSNPESLLLWLSYFDTDGLERALPPYSLITSRGQTSMNRRKRTHYALICSATEPLDNVRGAYIDAAELRNLSTGKPLGFSQVTSVVKRTQTNSKAKNIYEIGFCAKLHNVGQVRLARSVEVTYESTEPALIAAKNSCIETWIQEVNKLKNRFLCETGEPCADNQLSIAL